MWETLGLVVRAVCEVARTWGMLARVCILTLWLAGTFVGVYWTAVRIG